MTKETEDAVEDSYGECYLHGFMNGEVLDCGKFETRDFRLSRISSFGKVAVKCY